MQLFDQGSLVSIVDLCLVTRNFLVVCRCGRIDGQAQAKSLTDLHSEELTQLSFLHVLSFDTLVVLVFFACLEQRYPLLLELLIHAVESVLNEVGCRGAHPHETIKRYHPVCIRRLLSLSERASGLHNEFIDFGCLGL